MSGNFLKDNLPWIAPTAAIVLAATGYFDFAWRGAETEVGLTQQVPAMPVIAQPQAALAGRSSQGQEGIQPGTFAQPSQQQMLLQQQMMAQQGQVFQPGLASPAVAAQMPQQAFGQQQQAFVQPQQPFQQAGQPVQPIQQAGVQPQGQQPVQQQFQPAPQVSRNLTPEAVAPLAATQQGTAADAAVRTALSAPRRQTTAASPTDDPAGFFGNAQANIANENSCVEDLKSLAAQARVYFPAGGVTGEEAGLAQARLIGLVAQECPNVTIQVEGHSDPSGNPQVNLRLSQQRAQAIVDRVAAAGIDTSKFRARGFGSARPSSIRGEQSAAFYDRRVEFSVIEDVRQASLRSSATASLVLPRCVADLQQRVDATKLFFAPRSITVSESDLAPVYELAARAANCPQARLRVVGQHADVPGSGETPATGRLRAIALMGTLVSAGFEPEKIIIAAPSTPTKIAGRGGLSDRRIDFDVIYDDRL